MVLGLLSGLPRKNCRTIAEWAGEASPHGTQHLLCRAVWDAGAVRDDVREYVVEHLHDEAAVLFVDETGDVKKGMHTVGVRRQYTGTAGRIENSAVHLDSAGARGHAAVDRELYIPRSWCSDRIGSPGSVARCCVVAQGVFAVAQERNKARASLRLPGPHLV
ncbi:transposase [Streptomyces sp. MBT53]|uniref:transposase n=1 Tax=Streptomyces sp. MBT53 TaxID=1488384 RepID=UPI0035AC0C72